MTVRQVIEGLKMYDIDLPLTVYIPGFIMANNLDVSPTGFDTEYEKDDRENNKPIAIRLIFDPE